MKLVSYVDLPLQSEMPPIKLGALLDETTVVDLVTAQTWAQGAHRFSARELPGSMLKVLNRWDELEPHLNNLLSLLPVADVLNLRGAGRQPVARRRSDVILLPPITNLLSLRLFDGFERHARNRCRLASKPVPPAWYLAPVFSYGNPYTISGPDRTLTLPADATDLDFSFQIACVIGREGQNITPDDAPDHIAGYTILNDWRLYDEPGVDPGTEFGIAKASDILTSIGPSLVTPDELADREVGSGADLRHDLPLTVHINDDEVSTANLSDIHWTFSQMIAHASHHVRLYPGEVIASGAIPCGSLVELDYHDGWLRPGDRVTLIADRLGILETTIIAET